MFKNCLGPIERSIENGILIDDSAMLSRLFIVAERSGSSCSVQEVKRQKEAVLRTEQDQRRLEGELQRLQAELRARDAQLRMSEQGRMELEQKMKAEAASHQQTTTVVLVSCSVCCGRNDADL